MPVLEARGDQTGQRCARARRGRRRPAGAPRSVPNGCNAPRIGAAACRVNMHALEDRGRARAARGMKRASLALLATVLPALSAAPHAATLGVSMALFDDNFLTAVRASMKARARELDVSIQFEDAQNDIGRQLNQIQNFIAQKVDAIIVNPVDTDATPRTTRLTTRAGIPLVYVNRLPADKQLPPRVSFVGSDETQSGTLEMAEVCRLLKGKGEIVVLIGELTNQAARQRTQDVQDVIARPGCRGIRILDKQAADWKRTQAADLMTNWLSAGLRPQAVRHEIDRKSTRLNSSHEWISYAVFCLKKK